MKESSPDHHQMSFMAAGLMDQLNPKHPLLHLVRTIPAVPKATHKRIKDAVRRYCDVTAFSLRNQGAWIKAFADDIARTKENLIDIINAMLEILVKESIELPAFSTQERIAYSSRARANATYFRTITQTLSPRTVDTLAALLSTKTDSGITHWQVLKSEPKKTQRAWVGGIHCAYRMG